jgi:plastocyanin
MKSARTAPIALALILSAVSLVPARAADPAVAVKDNYYTPVRAVVFIGDTVTWTDSGDQPHTVTAFDQSFDSSPRWNPATGGPCESSAIQRDDCMRDGDSYAHKFTKAGSYNYFCRIHGRSDVSPSGNNAKQQPCQMCGQIIVVSRTSSSPVVRRTPTGPSPSKSASTSPKASTSASPRRSQATGSPSTSQSGVAAGNSSGGGLGEAGRLTAATVAIIALIAAGYGTWRRYLHTRY